MQMLILGRGKTGSLVAEVARERGHIVEVMGSKENQHAAALTPEKLQPRDCVIDFTNPQAVQENIQACVRARKNMVVGTTGWYGELAAVREQVERSGIGFVYAANFSIGVNLLFDIARSASAALKFKYSGHINERHHAQKKDAPSGTAIMLQRLVKETAGAELPISSFREGDAVGMHELIFESENDSILLLHDAKSRRGFAEGAVRAAEWLKGKTGFYNFQDVWRQLD